MRSKEEEEEEEEEKEKKDITFDNGGVYMSKALFSHEEVFLLSVTANRHSCRTWGSSPHTEHPEGEKYFQEVTPSVHLHTVKQHNSFSFQGSNG
jgi:hypothetical protein